MRRPFYGVRNGGRRAFLCGVGGVTLGLPLLEFTHERAWAATGPLKRLVVVCTHGGETMNIDLYSGAHRSGNDRGPKLDDWLPKPGWQFGEAMEPIRTINDSVVGAHDKDLQNKLLVLRGVDNLAGLDLNYSGDHYAGPGAALTQAKGVKTDNEHADLYGPSIDAVAAQGLSQLYGGRATPVNLSVWGFMYKTAFFSGTLGNKATPQAGEVDPAKAWQALFTGVPSSDSGPDPDAVRAAERKGTILNSLMDGYRSFRTQLGVSDQRIVDAHLDHLADLEKQIAIASSATECIVPNRPAGFDPVQGYTSQAITGPLMADLTVAALRCGLTNVVGFEISDCMQPEYTTNQPDGHDLGHRVQLYGTGDAGDDYLKQIKASGRYPTYEEWLGVMRRTRAWRLKLAKRIAAGLDGVMEGSGTMLDNSVVLYTSESSCGGDHTTNFDMPFAILGGGNYFKTGQYVEYNTARRADPTSLQWANTATSAQVYTTILNSLGIEAAGFGHDDFNERQGNYGTGALSDIVK